jgi:transposase
MQPKRTRRVYSTEFKASVLAQCEQPGASVAAVSLSHGLNVNLVRKWLVGRGLKRTGLEAPRSVMPAGTLPKAPRIKDGVAPPVMQFVPVELTHAVSTVPVAGVVAEAHIHIELRRGSSQLTVRWPSSQAGACAGWLRELALGTLK